MSKIYTTNDYIIESGNHYLSDARVKCIMSNLDKDNNVNVEDELNNTVFDSIKTTMGDYYECVY